MVDLEKLLGKKKIEIPFYEDTKRMIDFAEQKDERKFYLILANHYGSLTQLDGLREDMKKVESYLRQKSKGM
jgi:hypothetical protein